MILTLKAVSLNDQPLSQTITACFDANGGTIGRADHNTLALPDPERHISRLQAEIVQRGAGYLIRNVGSANPITVGSRVLAQGEAADLAQDDQLRVGGYVLQVDFHDQSQMAHEITRGRPLRPGADPALAQPPNGWAPTPATAPGANPFADLLGSGLATVAAAGEPGRSPYGGTLGGPSSGLANDPFADLLGPAAGNGHAPSAAWLPPEPAGQAQLQAADPFEGLMPGPAGVQSRSPALAAAPPPAPRLPDDLDLFSPLPERPVARAAPARPFDDLGLGPQTDLLDRAFGLGQSGHGDPLSDFVAQATAAPPAPGGGGRLATDPLLLFPGAAPAERQAPALETTAPAVPAQSDHAPAIHGAFQLPKMQPVAPRVSERALHPLPPPPPPTPPTPPTQLAAVPPPPPAPPPAQPPPATAGTAGISGERPGHDDATLWAAFCQGAGIAVPLPPGSGPERMRALGQVMNIAVAGLLQLINVRASTKQEFRGDVTMIQSRNNNPLKFSPDAQAALEQLVQPPARGFLDGPVAMQEAVNDLVGHAIGSAVGMRAAIEGMLDRFDPAELEAKLSPGSRLDNLLAGNRRARLWDLYLQHHGAIREEAQEDFHTLFGKAFMAAYQQQIDRLRARAAAGAPPQP